MTHTEYRADKETDMEEDRLTQKQIDGIMAFIKSHAMRDTEKVYTNGSDLVDVFRVEQALQLYQDGKVRIYGC